MISVIIPAHNEAAVIGRTLSVLTTGASPNDLEIVVVCNGCSDDTAGVARGFGPMVQVIETPVASKVNALNLGDSAARSFPRFYVDADVMLSYADLRGLADVLDRGEALAVAPLPRFDVAGCSWFVRAYYDVHQRLPAFREGIGGSGVYGVSEEGRERFGPFPDITADDGFVRLQFAMAQRRTIENCRSVVVAPKTLRELVAIKTRSFYGTAQLKQRYPELFATNLGTDNGASLRRLMLVPWMWPKLAAYAYVKVTARRRARRQLAQGQVAWERDESSRSGQAQPTDARVDRLPGLVVASDPVPGAPRVLAVASGGGHWVQLLRTIPAFEGSEVAFVTVNGAYRDDVGGRRFYLVNDATRWDKIGLVRMLIKLVWILVNERPDVIISTGAAPGYFALRIGKLIGARTIWLDSIANVEQLSMSGQKIGKHADLWLTQWPHLAGPDGPQFAGAVL